MNNILKTCRLLFYIHTVTFCQPKSKQQRDFDNETQICVDLHNLYTNQIEMMFIAHMS